MTHPQQKKKGGRKLKFEGFITPKYKSDLYFWTGSRTSDHMVDKFTEYWDDEDDKFFSKRVFQSTKFGFDRAPAHTAKNTKTALDKLDVNYFFFPRNHVS